jgi:hypothetical protein
VFKVTIPKIVLIIVTSVFFLHLSKVAAEKECWKSKGGGPTFQGNLKYLKFQYDPNNPDIMGRNSSVEISIIGGIPPYTWDVTGMGFILSEEVTKGLTNTLIANDTACGTATIIVTDKGGAICTGYARCTAGSWAKKEAVYACGFGGSCFFHQYNCTTAKEVISGYKKWEFPANNGYCAYGETCDLNSVNWDLDVGGGACISPVTYPPPCGSPKDCHDGSCTGTMSDEAGCVHRKYVYYEWECQ